MKRVGRRKKIFAAFLSVLLIISALGIFSAVFADDSQKITIHFAPNKKMQVTVNSNGASGSGEDLADYVNVSGKFTSGTKFQKDVNGQYVSATEFSDGDSVNIHVEYHLDANDVPNKKAYFKLPDGVAASDTTGDILETVGKNSVVMGTYQIVTGSDGKKYVIFNYNDNFDPAIPHNGTFDFSSKLEVTQDSDQDQVVYLGGDSAQIVIHQNYDMSITKGAVKQDGNDIQYSVVVSSQKGTGDGTLTVTDTFSPAGSDTATASATYKKDVTVTKNDQTVTGYQVDYNTDGQMVISNLPKLGAGESYTITYGAVKSGENADGSAQVHNKVRAHVDTNEAYHAPDAETTKDVTYNSKIKKSGWYDKAANLIKWTVDLNSSGDKIKSYTSLTDNLPDGLQIIGNVTITNAYNGGQKVEYTPSDRSKVSFDPSKMDQITPASGTQNTIHIDDNSTGRYLITFTTNAPSGNGDVSNTVNTTEEGKGYSGSGTVGVTHRTDSTTKRVGNVSDVSNTKDSKVKKFTWAVAQDFKEGEVSEFKIEDVLGSIKDSAGNEVDAEHYAIASELNQEILSNIYGNILIDGESRHQNSTDLQEKFYISIEFKDADGNRVDSSDSTKHVASFTIYFKAKNNQKYNVTSVDTGDYHTYADLTKLPNGNYKGYNHANTADANNDFWLYVEEPKPESPEFEKRVKNKNNQYVSTLVTFRNTAVSDGMLDYLIYFTVQKDQNGDIDFTDILPDGMTYVDGSASFGFFDVNWNVFKCRNNDVNQYPFTFEGATAKVEGQKVLFHMPGGYNPKGEGGFIVGVKYKASVADDVDFKDVTKTSKLYTNTVEYNNETTTQGTTIEKDDTKIYKVGAQVYADGTPVEWKTGEDGKTYIVNKPGNPATDNVRYSVVINPKSEEINGGNPLTLVDHMSANWNFAGNASAQLIQESVKLYYYDPRMPFSAGQEVDPSDYRTEYDGEKLELTVTVPDKTALTLVYQYHMNRGSNSGDISYSNYATLTGYVQSGTTTTLRKEQSSATISGQEIYVYKVDADNFSKLLPGAEFTLSEYQGDGKWKDIRKNLTSDEDGRITIGSTDNGQVDGSEPQIEHGKLYKLTETKAPEGYSLDATPKYILWSTGTENETKDSLIKSLGSLTDSGKTIDSSDISYIAVEGGVVEVPNKSVSLVVKKRWVDQDGKNITPGADSVQVQLYQTTQKLDPVTVKVAYAISDTANKNTTSNSATYSVKRNGQFIVNINYWGVSDINMSVEGIPSAEVSFDKKSRIITINNVSADCTITLSGSGDYAGAGDFYLQKKDDPDYVGFRKEYGDPVTLNAANSWQTSWENLPVTDENGKAITYQVQELGETKGFRTEYQTGDGWIPVSISTGGYTGTYVIKNVSTKKRIPFTFSKVWLDENGKEVQWPEGVESIPFTLKASGNPSYSLQFHVTRDGEVTADEGYTLPAQPLCAKNGQKTVITINGLENKDSDGNAYIYSVTEGDVSGYSGAYFEADGSEADDKAASNGGTIRNSPHESIPYDLPATGSTGTRPYTEAGLVMLVLAAFALLYNKRHSR